MMLMGINVLYIMLLYTCIHFANILLYRKIYMKSVHVVNKNQKLPIYIHIVFALTWIELYVVIKKLFRQTSISTTHKK